MGILDTWDCILTSFSSGESAVLVQKAIRMYWLGYKERCNHFIEKSLEMIGQSGEYMSYLMKFYLGLNSLDMVKKNFKVVKAKEAALKAIAAVRNAASSSEWNFAGKLQLMEAEHRAVLQRGFSYDQILACYDSAIAHAKQSRFIHEEGLACEKAGLYCKKIQNYPE